MGSGEHDATFEAAFEDLFSRAWRLAFRILHDGGAAEDVAAEALARAYARWASLHTVAHRDAWVLRVTTNLAIDCVRRKRPLLVPLPAEQESDATVVRLALVAALRSLPRRQREAIALRYLGGLSEADVAMSLGVSTGTVKTHLHRGVASLRERLGPTFEEDCRVLSW